MTPEGSVAVKVSLHTKASIIRTCYALSEIGHFWLDESDDAKTVTVNFVIKDAARSLEEVKHQLLATLIDFSLREQIEEKTSRVREVIISAALAGMLDIKQRA